jgi:hypothetical protein
VIHVQVTARMFLESKICEQSATIVSKEPSEPGPRSAWPSQQQGMGRGAVERASYTTPPQVVDSRKVSDDPSARN